MRKSTSLISVAVVLMAVSLSSLADTQPPALFELAQAQNSNGRGTVLTCTTTKRGGRIPYALPEVVTTEAFFIRNSGQGLQLERGNRGPEFLDNGRGSGNSRIGAPGQQISLTVRQDGLLEWKSQSGGRQANNRFEFGEVRRIVFDEQTGDVMSYETDDVVPVALVISEHTVCQ